MLVFLLAWFLWFWWIVQPIQLAQTWWLTQIYRSELEPAVQRYLDLHTTIEGWQDQNVIAQVATGNRLNDLLQSRCIECTGIEVASGIQVQTFEVLWYDGRWSKVRVRYEGAWQRVDPQTRNVTGQCNVGVYSIELLMICEDGIREGRIWKVSDVGEYIPKVISKDEFDRLHAKYCSR
jgi:hypothetical protein